MELTSVVEVASVVGVAIGLGIVSVRQRKQNARLAQQIRAELGRVSSLTLPELVTRVGLRDGFLNRGKLMNALNPLVASGELIQDEPPGTTVQNRLSVLRFRLRDQQKRAG